MFSAAGILSYRHPFCGHVGFVRSLGKVRAAITQHVPGRIHEGVHGVRFPAARATALWTHRVDEFLVDRQWRFTRGPKLGVLGQQHRQIRFRHRRYTARIAVHHRNGRPPVPLSGNQPVAQSIGCGAFPPTPPLHVIGDGFHTFFIGHAVIGARVSHEAFAHVGLGRLAAVPSDGSNDNSDGQSVLTGKRKIPMVVGRNTHHSSGAVSHQGVVGNIDGHRFVVEAVAA